MGNKTSKPTKAQKKALANFLKIAAKGGKKAKKPLKVYRDHPSWEDYTIYPILHKNLTQKLEDLRIKTAGSTKTSPYIAYSVPMDEVVETYDYHKIINQDPYEQEIPLIHKIYLFSTSPHNYFLSLENSMVLKVNKISKNVTYFKIDEKILKRLGVERFIQIPRSVSNGGGVMRYTGAFFVFPTFKELSDCFQARGLLEKLQLEYSFPVFDRRQRLVLMVRYCRRVDNWSRKRVLTAGYKSKITPKKFGKFVKFDFKTENDDFEHLLYFAKIRKVVCRKFVHRDDLSSKMKKVDFGEKKFQKNEFLGAFIRKKLDQLSDIWSIGSKSDTKITVDKKNQNFLFYSHEKNWGNLDEPLVRYSCPADSSNLSDIEIFKNKNLTQVNIFLKEGKVIVLATSKAIKGSTGAQNQSRRGSKSSKGPEYFKKLNFYEYDKEKNNNKLELVGELREQLSSE